MGVRGREINGRSRPVIGRRIPGGERQPLKMQSRTKLLLHSSVLTAHLQCPHAKHVFCQGCKPLHAEFKADVEEKEHHSKLRQVLDALYILLVCVTMPSQSHAWYVCRVIHV